MANPRHVGLWALCLLLSTWLPGPTLGQVCYSIAPAQVSDTHCASICLQSGATGKAVVSSSCDPSTPASGRTCECRMNVTSVPAEPVCQATALGLVSDTFCQSYCVSTTVVSTATTPPSLACFCTAASVPQLCQCSGVPTQPPPAPLLCDNAFSDFGPCSVECGGGVRTKAVLMSTCGLTEGTVLSQACNTQPCEGGCPSDPSGVTCDFCGGMSDGQCHSTSDMIECVAGTRMNFECRCGSDAPCQQAAGCQCLPRETDGNCPTGSCDCWRYGHTAARTCIGCPCSAESGLGCIQTNDRQCGSCGTGSIPCEGCWEGAAGAGLWYPSGYLSPVTGQICTPSGWLSCGCETCQGSFVAVGPCTGVCGVGVQQEVFTLSPGSRNPALCGFPDGATRLALCPLPACGQIQNCTVDDSQGV